MPGGREGFFCVCVRLSEINSNNKFDATNILLVERDLGSALTSSDEFEQQCTGSLFCCENI